MILKLHWELSLGVSSLSPISCYPSSITGPPKKMEVFNLNIMSIQSLAVVCWISDNSHSLGLTYNRLSFTINNTFFSRRFFSSSYLKSKRKKLLLQLPRCYYVPTTIHCVPGLSLLSVCFRMNHWERLLFSAAKKHWLLLHTANRLSLLLKKKSKNASLFDCYGDKISLPPPNLEVFSSEPFNKSIFSSNQQKKATPF